MADYRPGHFYERELPVLLKLLGDSGWQPDTVVVDGYVFLDGQAEPGLGKHLHDALGGQIPVVGVAKTSFRGIGAEYGVLRGTSQRPLFVTAVGLPVAEAQAGLRAMHGEHRMPTLLTLVDQLCRQHAAAAAPANTAATTADTPPPLSPPPSLLPPLP